jgi:hypothetical protein
LSAQESEANRAKDIGAQLDGARERASSAELERNKLALAKTVKAALWVTDARLNLAVPELLKMAQLWAGKSKVRGKNWKPPEGVMTGALRRSGALPFCQMKSKGTWRTARYCSTTMLCST